MKSDWSWQWLESGRTWPVRKFHPALLTSELHLNVDFHLLLLSLSLTRSLDTFTFNCLHFHFYVTFSLSLACTFIFTFTCFYTVQCTGTSWSRWSTRWGSRRGPRPPSPWTPSPILAIGALSKFCQLMADGKHLICFNSKVCGKAAAFRWGHHWGGLRTVSYFRTQEIVVRRTKLTNKVSEGLCNGRR